VDSQTKSAVETADPITKISTADEVERDLSEESKGRLVAEPGYRKREKKSAEWEVAVEKPPYDLTIFKLNCGSAERFAAIEIDAVPGSNC
jgi:hypothetical protein